MASYISCATWAVQIGAAALARARGLACTARSRICGTAPQLSIRSHSLSHAPCRAVIEKFSQATIEHTLDPALLTRRRHYMQMTQSVKSLDVMMKEKRRAVVRTTAVKTRKPFMPLTMVDANVVGMGTKLIATKNKIYLRVV